MTDLFDNWIADMDRRIAKAQSFDADDSLTKQNFIEDRGWYYEGNGRWAKATPLVLISAELDDAYKTALREETESYDA